MGFQLSFKSNAITPGPHIAVCDKIIDMGEQVGAVEYGSKITHQVYIGWELTDEDGVVKHIGRCYNLSKDPKSKLRQHLES